MNRYGLLEIVCVLISISLLVFFSIEESKENKEKKEIEIDKGDKDG